MPTGFGRLYSLLMGSAAVEEAAKEGITAEYCSRPQPTGKLCRNIAPVQKWAKNSKKDLVFSEYRREYKRHFAWIKAGKISEEQFAAWAKLAKAKKHECDAEKISLDEFKAWLKNS